MIRSVAVVCCIAVVVLAQPPPDNPTCFQGNTKKVQDCCKMKPIVDQSIIDRCAAENPKLPPTPGVPRTEGCCVGQCAMTTVNAFANNAIDKAAALKAITASIGSDAAFAPLLSGIVDTCFNSVNANPAFKLAPVSATPGKAGCSFLPEAFANCVQSAIVQQCPTAAWTAGAECDQVKKKLTSGCSFFSLMM